MNQSNPSIFENSFLKKDVNISIIHIDHITPGVFNDTASSINQALRELGFNSNITSNVIYNDPDVTDIIFACQFLNDESKARLNERSILVNMEPLESWTKLREGNYNCWFHRILYLSSKCQVWDYSKKNLPFYNSLGLWHPKYLRLGYNPELCRIPENPNKDIDVLFYGSFTPRRSFIIDKLKERGVNVVGLYDVFGEQLDQYIARAKIVLNLHANEPGIFEGVRCNYLMHNKIAVVSEINSTTTIDDPSYLSGIAVAPYEELVDRCCELLNQPQELARLREAALTTIQRHSQTEIMRKLIQKDQYGAI